MSTPIGSSQWMYASGAAAPQQSLKFNDDESQYLSWTPAAAGNRKTWTWSGWVKRGNIGSNQYLFQARIDDSSTEGNKVTFYFMSSNKLRILNQTTVWKETSAVFRDTSAWYHIVLSVDTTNATTNNRIRIYINGEEASYSTNTGPSLNADLAVNSTNNHYIGQEHGGASYLDGYLSDIHFIDGQALDASSFGETVDGYWKAKDYAGTYGTNGFHLTFQDDVVSEGFNAVTYRGNGGTQSISGLGFSPDLVWIKSRSATYNHVLIDSVRGVEKELISNNTNAEAQDAGKGLTSFDGDGFTLKLGTSTSYNNSSQTYVGWCWDAGSGSAASNTEGSITSSIKANPSYGFSIVSYTGTGANATVGHGLSSAPEFVIVKERNGTGQWSVQSTGLSAANKVVHLQSTAAEATKADHFNSTLPTSTVFSVGTSGNTNGNTSTFIAYCFSEVANYSSIGSYSGTGSSGNAVTGLGFKPAFLMVKGIDVAEHWVMFDNTRSPTNPVDQYLLANSTNAEETNQSARAVDFDADGFTVDGTSTEVNQSGKNYLYIAFADTREAAFWKDVSGNNNNWTPNNLDYRDSLIDSPANNFATLNPLFTNGGSTQNFKEGNLQFTADGNYALAHGTFAMRTGKWYWETYIKSWVSVPAVGISRGTNTAGNSYVGYDPNGDVKSFGYASGGIIYGASGVGTSAGSQLASGQTTYTTGDVIGCSFDADVGELKFYKNGTLIYTVSSIDEFDWMPATSAYNGGINIVNFGQDSTFSGNTTAGGNQDDNGVGDFKHPVPSGFLALASSNLPTPTIVDGTEHFNTLLWTGNGSHIDVGFDPDLLWYKARNTTSYGGIVDSIRGDDVYLQSYSTNADVTSSGLLVTDSTGFTPGSAFSSNNYVAWNWKAGGTAVSNTAGSITSQVSANTTAGFSIVSYVADGTNSSSVGHGLSTAPSIVIQKNRDAASDWLVLTDLIDGSDDYLLLNSTAAAGSAAGGMTATTFVSWDRPSGNNMIAYCFANSDTTKIGSYTGNGSTDGPMVFTGHKPSFLLVKSSTYSGTNWLLFDNKRDVENPVELELNANNSNQEYNNGRDVDFVSNGFKIRSGANNNLNTSGGTYIYLAFAETPFKFANAR